MRVEDKEYSKEEFLSYLTEKFSFVFGESSNDQPYRTKWMKIYSLLVSDQNWKERIFQPDEIKQMGEIFRYKPLKIKRKQIEEEESEEYFIVEHKPGLILMITSANSEIYHKDLGRRIKKSRGITELWMHPDLFEEYWKEVVHATKGNVYYFSARRNPWDETICRIRPEMGRRLNYTGYDAKYAMEELCELYGVRPEVVYIEAIHGLKLHVSNNGLFSAQKATQSVLDMYYELLDKIEQKVLHVRQIASDIRLTFEHEDHIVYPLFEVGIISFNNPKIDDTSLSQMKKNFDNFSFIDTHIEYGSINITATVMDNDKKSIFSITATDKQIIVVPKYRTTFETFISFYKNVVETIDIDAKFGLVESS